MNKLKRILPIKPNTTALRIKKGYDILFWNQDSEVFAFKTVFGNIHSVPFLLRWKQPKKFKEFLLEILDDFDNGIADESEIYSMSIDLHIPKTAVGKTVPMNMIIFYKEYNNEYTCFYGSSFGDIYQSFTVSKNQMADFIKSILKAINNRGIKREIFL